MDEAQSTHIVAKSQKDCVLNNDVKGTTQMQDETINNTDSSHNGAVEMNTCCDTNKTDKCSNITVDKANQDTHNGDNNVSNDTNKTDAKCDQEIIQKIKSVVEEKDEKEKCVPSVPTVCVHLTTDDEEEGGSDDHNVNISDESKNENDKVVTDPKDPKDPKAKTDQTKTTETCDRESTEQNDLAKQEQQQQASPEHDMPRAKSPDGDLLLKDEDPIEDPTPSSSSSSSSSNSANSRFSFFRSIQNILIATKWSKLRQGTPKPPKDPNLLGEDQQHKGDRQRKISQKSPSFIFRKKSSDEPDNKNKNHEDNHNSGKASEVGREGLELLNSPTGGPGKDKKGSHSKGYFSLIKRHSAETPPSSPPSPPPADLTEAQKTLLRSSWAEIGDSVGQVGVIAFIGLFETHPDVKDAFNQFKDMSLDAVFNSISLKEHALRVMTTVEKFLNRIDRPDKLQKILEDLGKRHVAYRFNSDYINIVGKQFICAMRPHVSQWTPDTEEAWNRLVDVMTYHMERGARMEAQQSAC